MEPIGDEVSQHPDACRVEYRISGGTEWTIGDDTITSATYTMGQAGVQHSYGKAIHCDSRLCSKRPGCSEKRVAVPKRLSVGVNP